MTRCCRTALPNARQGHPCRATGECAVVIVTCIAPQDSAEVRLADDGAVIEALTADRPNQAFRNSVLPRRSGRGRFVPDTHRAQAPPHHIAIDRVTVTDKVPRRFVPWERLGDLPRNPFRRGMPGDAAPDKQPPICECRGNFVPLGGCRPSTVIFQ
jgi:hypothetical protein